MLINYTKAGYSLMVRKVFQDMRKMKEELNEHRYYQEKNIAKKTEHLLKKIDVLESCNATLCGKLASSQKALMEMQKKQQEENGESIKLYMTNVPKHLSLDLQEKIAC